MVLRSMQILEERIIKDGLVIGTDTVKVDSFLNQQLDVNLFQVLGKEVHRRFQEKRINKILTIEASGIAIATVVALEFGGLPLVYAKKVKASTMIDDCYSSPVKSFTKGTVSNVLVSKQYLQKGDCVLIIDDFLAHGEAMQGLISLCEQAGAEVIGLCSVIEKVFQGGGDKLRAKGYHLESLAKIKAVHAGEIIFAD